MSKIGKLLPSTTYEIEFKEEDFEKDGKTYKMKWIEKAATTGACAASVPPMPAKAPESAMSKDDWIEKERRSRKVMIMSYAKDILCAQIGAGKLLLVSDMIKWYEEMLAEVEK